MSLGIGVLFGVILFLVIVLCLPIQFQFDSTYQKEWSVVCTIRFLWWRFPIKGSGGRAWSNQFVRHNSIEVDWSRAFVFAYQALQSIAKRIALERLNLYCRLGWSRADMTAYSYGIFWAMVSALPQHWLEKSKIIYEPDFQQNSKEIAVHGIISVKIAHLIGIMLSLFRLGIGFVAEQYGKEQKEYETGLCRRADGNSNGEY